MESPINSPEVLAKALIGLGFIFIIAGLIVLYKDRFPLLSQLGHLPGDIAIEKENFKFYFPLATSILFSLILTFILWLFKR